MSRRIILLLLLISAAPVSGEQYHVKEVWAFASPDSSLKALSEFLGDVDRAVYISTYTLDSELVARILEKLLRDGREVYILVEDSPVGGIPEGEARILSRLQQLGAKIYLSGEEFRFYHGKYLVADNESLLITTENLGRNGFPEEGRAGNRGWGIVLVDEEVARYYATIFQHDLARAAPFEKVAPSGRGAVAEARGYAGRFRLRRYRGSYEVTPVVAPENAVESIISLIARANRSLDVEQFYIYKYWGSPKTGSVEETPNLFLEAALDAARRGVKVRLLLDDTWYNTRREDPVSNYNTLLYVSEIARREGLDLEARLVSSEELGFEKLHAKGVVVDGKIALISSVNWNENSPRRNREVGVIVYGEPAEYYEEVFRYDWGERGGGVWSEAVIVILAAAAIGCLLVRKHEKG